MLVEALGLEGLAEEVAAEEVGDLAEAVGGVDVGGDAWATGSAFARRNGLGGWVDVMRNRVGGNLGWIGGKVGETGKDIPKT